jgi:FAS-associated factor 2
VCVQLEGPLSPAELVEILQTTLEEQGLAFGSAKAKRDEKIRADRRLREMQDAAYFKALQIDQVDQFVYIYLKYEFNLVRKS